MTDTVRAAWDPPDLEPIRDDQRCDRHSHCQYRQDDPTRCRTCHRGWEVLLERGWSGSSGVGQTRRDHVHQHQRIAAAAARKQGRAATSRKAMHRPLTGLRLGNTSGETA